MNKTIENLKKLKSFHNGSYGADIDRAIKALEQEPYEDCISREEFEKRIKPYDTEDDMDKALYNFAHNILICCPSVTPKQNTGHWKKYKSMIYCSECGASIEAGYLDDMNYCHNCGARMESEE